MSSTLLENPKLFRHVVEDSPFGVYLVDGERRIRFWNHTAEHLTGHLSHEVVGHVLEDAIQVCDRRGNSLAGEHNPVTMTLSQRKAQQCNAFYLHKSGHRTAVRIHTHPIREYGDTSGGAMVFFEEHATHREDAHAAPMYGCLDAVTGIPSLRLTTAMLHECVAGMNETHVGFGLLLVRMLGMKEFMAQHGPQSLAPFLRTAAQTVRGSLNDEQFLGCWGEREFLAVLPSESPVMLAMKADVLWNLLHHSEVLWWGDHFLIQAEVAYSVVAPGDELDARLRAMRLCHSSEVAATATAAGGERGGHK